MQKHPHGIGEEFSPQDQDRRDSVSGTKSAIRILRGAVLEAWELVMARKVNSTVPLLQRLGGRKLTELTYRELNALLDPIFEHTGGEGQEYDRLLTTLGLNRVIVEVLQQRRMEMRKALRTQFQPDRRRS